MAVTGSTSVNLLESTIKATKTAIPAYWPRRGIVIADNVSVRSLQSVFLLLLA